jgi:hypothetical protein
MPRKLAVYSVSGEPGVRVQDDQEEQSGISNYALAKIYDHDLTRIAYNFTYGPFGGAYGMFVTIRIRY